MNINSKELVTLRLLMASWSIWTTSLPTTPLQSKPLVHFSSRADARPFCTHGNENVKPSGYSLLPITRFSAYMKPDKHLAMWSKSCGPEPVMIDCGIKNTFDLTLISPESKFMSSTRKLVPPKSSARMSPRSVPSGKVRTYLQKTKSYSKWAILG